MAVYLAGWTVPMMVAYLAALTVLKMVPRKTSKTGVYLAGWTVPMMIG